MAKAYSPKTGIEMIIHTTDPGVQLYTGNSLGGEDSQVRQIFFTYDDVINVSGDGEQEASLKRFFYKNDLTFKSFELQMS